MKKLLPVLNILTTLFSCIPTGHLQKEVSQQITSETFVQSFTDFIFHDPEERKVLF